MESDKRLTFIRELIEEPMKHENRKGTKVSYVNRHLGKIGADRGLILFTFEVFLSLLWTVSVRTHESGIVPHLGPEIQNHH